MITSSLCYVHLKLVGHVSHFPVVYLLTLGYWNGFCWLWVTEMGWSSETVSSHVVKALQSLPVWKQCFQTQFEMDFWQWKCFQNVFMRGLLIAELLSLLGMFIVAFSLWCFICILFFCVNLWGQWRTWHLRPSLPVPVFLIKYFVLGRDA